MFERVLKAGMAYELVALHSPLPTITSLVWVARHRPLPIYAASVAVVVAGLGYAAFHLLLEGWDQ